jgi:hypothetical protein
VKWKLEEGELKEISKTNGFGLVNASTSSIYLLIGGEVVNLVIKLCYIMLNLPSLLPRGGGVSFCAAYHII